MAATTAIVKSPKLRSKKRAYRKSTLGCRNCKLRRVKCDETKPGCENCIRFGVTCNYLVRDAELRTLAEAVEPPTAAPEFQCSLNSTILATINHSLLISYASYAGSASLYQLDMTDLQRLHRFQTRTSTAMFTPVMKYAYDHEIIRLVGHHPYLMHAIMTLTCAHDRFMNDAASSKPGTLEAYHLHRTLALFNKKLDMKITSADKDPIWATCGLMKGICLANNYSSCPEEAWPLDPEGSSPFDWLKLQDGNKAVWRLISPLDPGSAFNFLANGMLQPVSLPPPSFEGCESVGRLMTKLFKPDESSHSSHNPYRRAVPIILSLMGIDCNESTVFQFFCFSAELKSDLRRLLFIKEPRALLLLAYWYAMVSKGLWHMQRRATVECQSICIYLEKHHADNLILLDLLQFPKIKSGLLPSET